MQKEINKLLKRISAEKLKNNHKECIELYNIVGGLYTDIGSYDEAIHYHEKAFAICKTVGDRLNTAIALRHIGEAKAALGQFNQAVDHVKKYLELAQLTNNKVEIQRAWTTLGRVYLMHAQDMKENSHLVTNERIKETAREAEKRFQTALKLTETVREQVDEKEYAQMNSSLLVNIGLVKDICGQHTEAVQRFYRAIEICKSSKLREDLYRCQIVLASIFRQKNNLKLAAKTGEEALITAKQIGKKLLICDAFIERGLLKLSQKDFKNAKRAFAQAYLEKSPNEEDHTKAIRLTKLSHLIAINYEKLTSQDGGLTSEIKMKICDKLGDLFVAIDHYKQAVEFYRRAFSEARICSRPKSELARILYSMAETYADDGQYEHALVCFEKELVCRNGNDSEQCQTLTKIAHMYDYLNKEPVQVAEAYEKALVKAGKDPKLIYLAIKDYIPYLQKKEYNPTRLKELDNLLLNVKSFPEVAEEITGEGEQEVEDLEDEVTNIDDIITDDEENDEVLMVGRRRAHGTKRFKPNEVGDTPLHEACIKGQMKRVQLLLDQGHEVNPRDNAGWIPLHEACNHGHYNIVELLLENGADVNNRGLKGVSPLHDAASNGHFEIMRLLIKNGANVIALTDCGETVLSCLRDYKKRNYDEMSNRSLSEYKQMEAELMNLMDKSGFNFMTDSINKIGNSKSLSADTVKASRSNSATIRPRTSTGTSVNDNPLPRMNVVERPIESDPVRDYKHAIGNLKRKQRTVETTDKKARFEPEVLILGEANKPPVIVSTPSPCNSPEPEPVSPEFNSRVPCSSRAPSRKKVQCKSRNTNSALLSDEDESDFLAGLSQDADKFRNEDKEREKGSVSDEVEYLASPITIPPSPVRSVSPMKTDPSAGGSSCGSDLGRHKLTKFNVFAQPLIVNIESKYLLIPVKNEFCTIKWLKDAISDRYATLTECRPNVVLAPDGEMDCLLYDSDLLQDVLRNERLSAIIQSWQLDPIEEAYAKNCSNVEMEPLDFLRLEMRRIEETGNKLDLAYTRLPRSHCQPFIASLAHRNFQNVKLDGALTLFESSSSSSKECQARIGRVGGKIIDTIMSWQQLTHLSVRCVGLKRPQFETITGRDGDIAGKLPALKFLDLSYNLIVYKCGTEFHDALTKLVQVCPCLKKLDMSRNRLQFAQDAASLGTDLELFL